MLKFTFQHTKTVKKSNGNSWKPFLVFFALISSLSVSSQSTKKQIDSIVKQLDIENKITQVILESKAENDKKARQEKYLNYQKVQKQNKIFNLIEFEVQNAKFILNRGYDYKDITAEIHQLKDWEEFAVKG